MPLREYRRKRDFTATPEPVVSPRKRGRGEHRFVIQKHAASRLHFDFRLELGGTLVSWAIPKGIPLVHGEKRLAVKVEDHPLSYIDFEGIIPKGQYGGGTVQVWDRGTFEPLGRAPLKDLAAGKLHVILHGSKLSGEWYLVRMKEENQWLIVRAGDSHPKLSKADEQTSALSGRTMAAIAAAPPPFLSPGEIDFVEPMKARLVKNPPEGEWLYELKFDGYRALAYKEEAAVALVSRSRKDLTPRFSGIAEAVAALKTRQCILDGEIVALDSAGRSSFQLLQRYELGETRPPLCYYVFDLLRWNGRDTSRWPIEKRRQKLKALLPEGDARLRFSASLGSDAEKILSKVAEHHLEGVIGKRAGSLYEPGRRSGAWIKLKRLEEQEFVIGGFTDPEGTRSGFGALLVGYFEGRRLIYAGKVGTGFSHGMLGELSVRFSKLACERSPFANLPDERRGRYGQGITAAAMKRCHWLKPRLVAQVRFSEWTGDGRLRQPVFLGLRTDKAAREVRRETPA